VELRHVSMHGNSFLMHGGKGNPHPLLDGSCRRMKEELKRGRGEHQALLWDGA